MIIRIGCDDGVIYTSDHWPDTEIQRWLDVSGGEIFIGQWAAPRCKTVQEFADFMRESVGGVIDEKPVTSLRIVINGNLRNFSIAKIVWVETVMDQ